MSRYVPSRELAERVAVGDVAAIARLISRAEQRLPEAQEALAAIYDRIARYGQARSLLERALPVREARQKEQPLELAMCLNALAELRCRVERFCHHRSDMQGARLPIRSMRSARDFSLPL